MLNPESVFSFILVSTLLAVTPGPSNAFLLAQTMSKGKSAGKYAAAGFAIGGLVHTMFAVLGLSALLKASPTAYQLVQYLGAAYLFLLGIQTLNSAFRTEHVASFSDVQDLPKHNHKNVMWQAMLTEVLNPKVALFFIAFIPQFVDLSLNTSGTMQITLFGLLYAVLAYPIDLTYVHYGDKIAQYFKSHPSSQRWLDGLTGLIFVLLAVNILL